MTAQPGPELRDIHLPPAPDWWPPAPGWWIVALFCLAGIIVVFYTLWRVQRRRRMRRAVLAELDRYIGSAANDPTALAAALSQFLRRMALRDDPAAAALCGEAWLQWLDARSRSDAFSRGIGRALLDAPYRTSPAFDGAALTELVRHWTRCALEQGRTHA